jgi:predicted RecA/RadA family phage recombinase
LLKGKSHMKNLVQRGEILEVTAPAAVTSGDFVLVGSIGGIAIVSAASGAPVPLDCSGVVATLPKATGAAWSQGDVLYWDATNKNFTKTSSGNTKAGIAAAIAGQQSGDATGAVRLNRVMG